MNRSIFEGSYDHKKVVRPFILQSDKTLQIKLGADVWASKGTMVAYQGTVQFTRGTPESNKAESKRVGTALVRCSGEGTVYFARAGHGVMTVLLGGEAMCVMPSNLLAFEDTVNCQRAKVRGVLGSLEGLRHVHLDGQGQVALTCDGPPIILECSNQPVHVDAAAVVAWSANLSPDADYEDESLGSVIRGGTGEDLTYRFSGPGYVLVQPKERRTDKDSSDDSSGGGFFDAIFGDSE